MITKCRCGAYSLLTVIGFRYENNAGAICRHTPRACVWFSALPTPVEPGSRTPSPAPPVEPRCTTCGLAMSDPNHRGSPPACPGPSPAPVEPRGGRCGMLPPDGWLEEGPCGLPARHEGPHAPASPSPVNSGGTKAAYDWMSGTPCPHGLTGESAAWCLDCESDAFKDFRGGTGKRGSGHGE